MQQSHISKTNLSFCNLKGAHLSRTILNDANLENANLELSSLRFSKLRDANLKKTRLLKADLSGANLTRANLSGALIKYAILQNTCFREADLRNSDFRKADIRDSDLKFANLKGEDLTSTKLDGSDFSWSNLIGANLGNAHIGKCNFGDVNLGRTKGLDTINHFGPSSISINTVHLSEGKISECFLRGCGVSDNFIEYVSTLTNQAFQYYSCFISYSHADKSFAKRLHDQLQDRGIRCWLDEHQMLPGDDVYDQVDRGIRLWDKVLLCCSEQSLNKSWWVDNEINKAFKKEQQIMKDRGQKVLALIPLNIDGFIFSGNWESGKKDEVLSRLAADFTGWESDNAKFDKQFEGLVKALRVDTGASREKIGVTS